MAEIERLARELAEYECKRPVTCCGNEPYYTKADMCDVRQDAAKVAEWALKMQTLCEVAIEHHLNHTADTANELHRAIDNYDRASREGG